MKQNRSLDRFQSFAKFPVSSFEVVGNISQRKNVLLEIAAKIGRKNRQ